MITLKTSLFSTAPKPRQIVLQKLLRAKLQPTTWVTSHCCLPSMIGTSAWCKIPRFETNPESMLRNSTVFQRRFDSNWIEVVTHLSLATKIGPKATKWKTPCIYIRSYKYLTPSSYKTTNNKKLKLNSHSTLHHLHQILIPVQPLSILLLEHNWTSTRWNNVHHFDALTLSTPWRHRFGPFSITYATPESMAFYRYQCEKTHLPQCGLADVSGFSPTWMTKNHLQRCFFGACRWFLNVMSHPTIQTGDLQ